MSRQLTVKFRKDLKAEMVSVFEEKTQGLSVELQKILLNDIVTAFGNRLIVFKLGNLK
ncbi:MAG TPA: hypothetical protein VJY36_06995 [Candidatus Bathyarchaeia archaeon]|nr:hypothetical protein [Candidatus Bathyarchaeia archaeon]